MRVAIALLLPVITLLGIFLILPIGSIILVSLTETPGQLSGVEAYLRLVTDAYYLRIFAQTFVFSLGLTAITLVLAYPLATFISRTAARERNFLLFMIITPLLVSMVVRSYGWQIVLGNQGMINTALRAVGLDGLQLMSNWTGVVIASVHVLLPFAVISIAGVLSSLDRSVEESAAVLGASPARVFFKVTLPMAINGLVTAATFVFLLAMGSFVTIMMLGGRGTMVVPLLIYQQVSVTYNQPFAAAMATILMVITLGLLFAQFKLLRRRG